MYKYFVVSDVHSAYTPLMNALIGEGFDCDDHNHKLIVCGDLFDRMDETVKCFEFVKELQEQGRLVYIRGNHESLLKDCVEEIRRGRLPGYHHFGNGTVKSVCQFCGQNEWIIYDPTWTSKICETMQPVLDFIDKNCVDYYEVGNYIFTHAWLPTYAHLGDFRDADKSDWEEARWLNGMDMWCNPKNRVKGKIIVCGHWHVNWGHARIHQECSEWGDDAIFEPFVDEGITAIDSCVAYSGKINCIVIEDEDVGGRV